jgi:hypothetical protein
VTVVRADKTTIKAEPIKAYKVTGAVVLSLPTTLTRLSTFDNVGLTIGPYLTGTASISSFTQIVGRNIQYTSDVILWYTFDNISITTFPSGTSVAVFYFSSNVAATTLYPLGSIVRVVNINNSYDRTFTVLSSTSTSVSFLDPGDLPNTSGTYITNTTNNYPTVVNFTSQPTLPYIANSYVTLTNSSGQTTTVNVLSSNNSSIAFKLPFTGFLSNGSTVSIANASIEYYPQSSVSTAVRPTNARENLYYFYMAPGLRANNTIIQGIQFISTANNINASIVNKAPISQFATEVFYTPTSGNLQKQIEIIKDGRNNILSGTLTKQIEIIKATTSNIVVGKASTVSSIRSSVFSLPRSYNLQKQFEMVKATTSNIVVGKASTVSSVRSSVFTLVTSVGKASTVTSVKSRVFALGTSVGKASTVTSVKSRVFALGTSVGKASTVSTIKAITNIVKTDFIFKITILNQFETEVFDAPKSSLVERFNARNAQVFGVTPNYQLDKRIEIVKGLPPTNDEALIKTFIVGRNPKRIGEVFDVAYVNKVPIQFWN